MLDELPAEKLRNVFDPKLITCETTEVMAPLTEIVGQERAVKALNFGLEIDEKGFNVYVAGQPGTGRTTSVRSFLESIAIDKPVPSDWCYVNNFTDPYKPNAINLPPGKGKEFQRDMKNFIEETRTGIPKAFESEEYAAKREEISKSLEQQRRELFTQINERAKKEDFVIQSTAIGVLIIPVIQGQPMTDQQFMALSSEVRGEIEKRRDSLRSELRNAMRQLRDVDRELSEKLRDLNKEVANYATEHFINNLMEKYMEFPEVTKYLKEAQNDILENIDQFIGKPIQPQTPIPMPWMKELPFRKYKVNVIVDNSDLKGSPVVMELNPLHHNIFGRIEKEAQFGTLTTDFT
ncbi:AAA family ATPase, partial [Candidatus Bathyarchaeota archaeon]|nr:AAA family ATPase [Candidatus Bathyarchaeota archaeon]